ncbi:hypothetical protein RND81_04G043200 [Saponaria officinalis]|uniref:Uncharacterized protein n=1 Tax=Saponaria officinalis TaxID=3572 RepID=A0AAW1LCZ2_SAPOF
MQLCFFFFLILVFPSFSYIQPMGKVFIIPIVSIVMTDGKSYDPCDSHLK